MALSVGANNRIKKPWKFLRNTNMAANDFRKLSRDGDEDFFVITFFPCDMADRPHMNLSHNLHNLFHSWKQKTVWWPLEKLHASLLGKKSSDPNPVLLHWERILSIPSNPNRKDSGDLRPCGKWFSRRRRPHSRQNIYGYCIGRNLNDVITAANMNTVLLRRKSGCLWTTSLLPTSAGTDTSIIILCKVLPSVWNTARECAQSSLMT